MGTSVSCAVASAVAVVVVEDEGDPTTCCVVHASMSHGKVLEERLDVFLPQHDFITARRILHWPEAT